MAQPKSRSGPFARDCSLRNAESNGSLFQGKTGKKPKLDNPALAFIEFRQAFQRVIQENQIHASLVGQADLLIQWKYFGSRASFAGPEFSCCGPRGSVALNAPRLQRSGRDSANPADFSDHAQVRFMDQGCALNALTGRFMAKVTARQSPQFVVDERDQLLQGTVIAVSPPDQQFTYLRLRICTLIFHSQDFRTWEARCDRTIVWQTEQVKGIKPSALNLSTLSGKEYDFVDKVHPSMTSHVQNYLPLLCSPLSFSAALRDTLAILYGSCWRA